MKKLLAFLLIISSISVSAQRIIKGVVKNAETNEALNQASIKSQIAGVLTNKNGEFTITINDSTSNLYISSTGFQSDSIAVLPTVCDYSIYLKEAFNQLDEIVISGTMRSVTRLNSPIPVEVYTPALFKKTQPPHFLKL